jgi:hypothetical protein
LGKLFFKQLKSTKTEKNMKKEEMVELENYDPDALLDYVIDKLHLRSDAGLSRALKVGPPVLSKIRHKHLKISSDLLVRMHDVSDLGLDTMRKIAGIPRTPGTHYPMKTQVKEAEPVEA